MRPLVGIIIQARLTSSRLPRKHLNEIGGIPVLEHLVNRAHRSLADKVIIASPHSPECCLNEEIFIGDEANVLDRYYQASKKYGLDIIIRLTADCPFVPPSECNRVINRLLLGEVAYVTNRPNVPDGWDVEGFTFLALETAHKNAVDHYDLEHVTPWMKRELSMVILEAPKLSIDTEEDLENVRKFYELEREDGADYGWNGELRYQLHSVSSSTAQSEGHTDIFKRRA